MRKHFLILMLLTLLPFYGWAAEVSTLDLVAANKTFGTDIAITDLLIGSDEDKDKVNVDAVAYKLVGESYVSTTKTNVKDLAIGTYYAKISGKAATGYEDTYAYLEFLVIGKPLTAGMLQEIADKPYTGSAIIFVTTNLVKDGDDYLAEGTDYTATFSDNTNAGTATITFKGKGNYSGEVAGNFTITPKAFTTANVTVTVTENEVTYDGTNTQTAKVEVKDKALNKNLTLGDDFTVVYGGEHKNVGNYSITVKGKGNYADTDEIEVEEKLIINKATVLVSPSATKVYDGKATVPATYEFNYIGFVDDPEPVVTTTGVVCTSSDAKKAVGTYTLAVTTATANKFTTTPANYTFAPMDGTFEITQKAATITANDQTVAYGASIATNDVTLTDVLSADQAAVKKAVIVYQEGNVLKVKANPAAAQADKDVLANYDVTYQDGTLSTTKATITIALKNTVKLTKEFDGTPAAIAEDVTNSDNLTIIGSPISGDNLVLTGMKATVAENTGAVNTTPGYKVTLSGATVSANADKYTINYVTSYYKVTKKALKVSIPSQSAKAGDLISKAFRKDFFTVEGLISSDKKNDIFVLELANEAKNDDKIAEVESGKYINLAVKAGKETVANNYSGWTGAKGMLVIVPDASIVLNRPSKDAYNLDNTLDDAASVIAKAAVLKYTAEEAALYNSTLDGHVGLGYPTGAKFDEAGAIAYNAQLDGAVKTGDVKTPAEYTETEDETPQEGTTYYTSDGEGYVEAEGLTEFEEGETYYELTTDEVLYTDETAAEYNATLDGHKAAGNDACFTKAGAAAFNALLDGAVADGDVKTPAAYTETEDETPQEGTTYYTLVGEEYVEAEGLTEFEEGETYYELTTDEVLYTDETAAEYNAELANAVNPGDVLCYTAAEALAINADLEGAVDTDTQHPVDVTFGDFNMLAEKWYPVVLPFDTSVKEVSETFGYAIVNILNEDNTNDKKITFKLWMRDIPANTPFVVKVYQEKNMNSVSFDHKLIKNSTAPEVADKVDVKFIGSYSHKVGFKANEAFFSSKAENNDYYWGSETNTTYMAPLSAYFQIPESSPARTIEFQEADGSTTAIEIVGAEKLNTVKEGWYTINGMKLESAPVEKGIYINNGKKIVIK